ncbi:lithostathine-2-like [Saccostrea cucullata]|uniref:lithostathine-2-like n=1 Tax=Saccostrea cuccullata TaxID=36930 RepID=UPI002ED648BD
MQGFASLVCILQLYILHVGRPYQLTSMYKETILGRDSLFDGSTPKNTQYILTNMEETTRSSCVIFCLIYSSECASILYDEELRSCRLLLTHLSLNLTNVPTHNTPNDQSQYWARLKVCEDGWYPFASHCYFFYETKVTFDEALIFCREKESYLLELQSSLEISWIVDSFLLPVSGVDEQCPEFYSCSMWTGATDFNTTTKFIWTHSDTDMVFPEWGSGQPNNAGGDQHCISLMRDSKANDVSCVLRYQVICERE